MGLVQVDTFTIGSAVASVIIGGGSSGSSSTNFAINTDDVYMVAYNNVTPSTDARSISLRVTKSGSNDSTANYDYAYKVLNSASSFGNGAFTNNTEWQYLVVDNVGTGTSESANGIIYLYNFNSSSEYSFVTAEVTEVNSSATARGNQGGGVHTVASASDGVYFFDKQGGNIASGTFTLYKVV